MVIKLDAYGNKQWEHNYGGPGCEGSLSIGNVDIALTNDGGYVLLGVTQSFGAGKMDFWMVKLDDIGNQLWAKTFGGPLDDNTAFIRQTKDGGYVMCGFTASFGLNQSWALGLKTGQRRQLFGTGLSLADILIF